MVRGYDLSCAKCDPDQKLDSSHLCKAYSTRVRARTPALLLEVWYCHALFHDCACVSASSLSDCSPPLLLFSALNFSRARQDVTTPKRPAPRSIKAMQTISREIPNRYLTRSGNIIAKAAQMMTPVDSVFQMFLFLSAPQLKIFDLSIC